MGIGLAATATALTNGPKSTPYPREDAEQDVSAVSFVRALEGALTPMDPSSRRPS